MRSDAAIRPMLRDAVATVPLTFLEADNIADLQSRLRLIPARSVVLFIAFGASDRHQGRL